VPSFEPDGLRLHHVVHAEHGGPSVEQNIAERLSLCRSACDEGTQVGRVPPILA
jgi:hypothetical protein